MDGIGSQALTRQPADGLKGGSDVFTLTDLVLFREKKSFKILAKNRLDDTNFSVHWIQRGPFFGGVSSTASAMIVFLDMFHNCAMFTRSPPLYQRARK